MAGVTETSPAKRIPTSGSFTRLDNVSIARFDDFDWMRAASLSENGCPGPGIRWVRTFAVESRGGRPELKNSTGRMT